MLKVINAPTNQTITAIAYNTDNIQVGTSKILTEIRSGTYQYNPALDFADGAYDFRLFDGANVLGEVPYTLQDGAEATIATRSKHTASDVTTPILTASDDWATADLTPLGDAIALIPTTPLLAESYTAPDNTTIAAIAANAFDPSSDLVNVGKVAGFDVSSLGDFKADLSATNDAIALIPTNPLLADDYSAPDNTGIGRLTALLTGDFTKFTATALENGPSGSAGGGGLTLEQSNKLAAIPTDNTLGAIALAINTAKDEVLTAGPDWGSDLSETNAAIAALAGVATEERLAQLEGLDAGAIASQVRIVLTTQLDSIQDAATLAAVPLAAKTIQTDVNAITTYRDEAGNTIYQAQTFGVDNSPNYEQVIRQTRLSDVPV